MQPCEHRASLQVRLLSSSWQTFRSRASARQLNPDVYADMVFQYLLHHSVAVPRLMPPNADEEQIYIRIALPESTRRRLVGWSEREQVNLSSFGGALLAEFLARFKTDPRDFSVLYILRSRLDQKPVLSRSDLAAALALCERGSGVRLPAGYLARWLHDRIQPWLQTIENDGEPVAVTVELIDELLRSDAQS